LLGVLTVLVFRAPTESPAQTDKQLTEARLRMVRDEVVGAGIEDEAVIEALRDTPRHLFVSPRQRHKAYLDMALPIGEGQTISPPFVVAYMTEALEPKPTDRVLEIGTGSGYQAAVLSPIVAEVYSIEIVDSLGRKAAQTLRRQKYKNVHTKIGDGFQGWREHAPFDKVIVTCSPERIPVPLVEQLREGGRMVVPLGERYQQTLYLFKKVNGELKAEPLQPTFFVPMTGRAEELRIKKQDSGIPKLLNASFETVDEDEQLLGWYYVRQAEVVESGDAVRGERFLQFRNETAGRGAQALQAVGVNGRKISELEVSMWLHAVDVRPGQSPKQLPRIEVSFFDEKQAPCGLKSAGPWYGTISWTKKQAKIPVPPKAKLAVIAIGMFGGTGDLAIDAVNLRVANER
jgi:protein-L-isoaspartate(D-aspartate) O-methyltransferase